MASLLNGLSSAGSGLAGFAATAGLEAQKADAAMALQGSAQTFQAGQQDKAQTFQTGLLNQKAQLEQEQARLADQLTTKRELTIQGSAGSIAAAAAEKQQTFSGGQNELARQNQITLEKMRLSADPEDVRMAKAIQADPSLLETITKFQAAKSGMGSVFETTPGTAPTKTTTPDTSENATPAPPPSVSALAAPTAKPVTGTADVSDVLNDPKEDKAVSPRAAIVSILQKPNPNWNADALSNVSQLYRPRIIAMLEGREAPPPAGRVNPINTSLLNAAHLIDPTFDESTWKERFTTRQSMASGPIYQNTLNMNTAMGHVAQLGQQFAKEGNIQSPLLNIPLNWVSETVLGKSGVPDTRRAIDTAASEIRRALSGSAGSLVELQEWQKNFPLNGSPVQQMNAVKAAADILKVRMGEMTDQVNTALGKGVAPTEFLSPNAKKALEAIDSMSSPDDTGTSGLGAAGRILTGAALGGPVGVGAAIGNELVRGAQSLNSSAPTHPPLPPGFRVVQ